ncbi:hypothetical protein [Haloarchaeobius litoreus]|uniref:Branched-chain amino acid ABC transporter permease n=1 Tax=Haloarchaeobius litoreus TaxID=755306 RepID=A0ABD6DMK3_9EURY|nr:hypothetical protein [Haloarchaeobius litoreus]
MKRPDLVLFLIPVTYGLVGIGLLLLDVNVYNASLYASSLVCAIIAQALFVDPPV